MQVSIQGTEKGKRWLRAERSFEVGETVVSEAPRFFSAVADDSEESFKQSVFDLAAKAYLAFKSGEWKTSRLFSDNFGAAYFSEMQFLALLKDRPQGYSFDEAKQIYAVVATNNLRVFVLPANGGHPQTIGHGFFDTLSFANHCCYQPNCDVVPEGPTGLKLMARLPIAKHDPIEIAYAQFVAKTPLSVRQSYLLQDFGFVCSCRFCKLEKAANADTVRKIFAVSWTGCSGVRAAKRSGIAQKNANFMIGSILWPTFRTSLSVTNRYFFFYFVSQKMCFR